MESERNASDRKATGEVLHLWLAHSHTKQKNTMPRNNFWSGVWHDVECGPANNVVEDKRRKFKIMPCLCTHKSAKQTLWTHPQHSDSCLHNKEVVTSLRDGPFGAVRGLFRTRKCGRECAPALAHLLPLGRSSSILLMHLFHTLDNYHNYLVSCQLSRPAIVHN